MDIQFVVKGHAFKSDAGKPPVYKVSMKSAAGHSLILVSESRGIFEGFPKGDSVDVKVGKAQRTFDEIPGEA